MKEGITNMIMELPVGLLRISIQAIIFYLTLLKYYTRCTTDMSSAHKCSYKIVWANLVS